MNLNSLGSFSSLATSAFDTARATFKGLAEAAVASSGTDTAPVDGRPTAADGTPAARDQDRTETANLGRGRLGTLLDAYA